MPNFSFGKTPQANIEYLKDKGLQLSWDYDEMMYEAHHRAFTVAKVTKIDLLADIQKSLVDAMASGANYKQWHDNIKPTLIKHGWYGKTEVFNEETGEFKTITVGSKRLKNIYNTNMRVAYAQGRYHQLMGFKLATFWRYNSALLETTRDSHRALHGVILPREHIFWATHYPPNDWNCKCWITAHTQKDLDKEGWSVHAGKLPNIAHPDWAYNVGADSGLGRAWDSKIKNLLKENKSALAKAATEEKELFDLYDKSIENAPAALKTYLLANAPKIIVDKSIDSPAFYSTSLKAITITSTENNLLHVLRHETGHSIDHALNWISDDLIKILSLEQIYLLQNKTKQEILDVLENLKDESIHDMFYINSKGKIAIYEMRENFNFDNKNLIARETFANVFELILSGDDRLDIIRKYFPTTVEKIEKILKDL
ncbi:MAG: phage minor head protein [Sulfurovaceae bacterium]|nr:phage minor head protein [Sulfurovaceae bacterium]